MAVNTQKFLPTSKSGTLSVRTSKISVSPRTSGKGGQLVGGGGSLSKEILQMKVKVLRLHGEIDRNIKFNKKEQEDKRKVDEKEKRSQREKQLEKKDGFKGVNLPNVIDKLPGGSIIDTIKRFLGFTFLGWLVNKYEILMPQLEKFMSLTKPVFEGLLFTTEAIAKGVFGFVESGYKAYDALSSTVKKIGGEDAEKTFTQFSTQLNGLLNGTFMLAMLVASTSPGGRTGGVPGGKPKGAVRTPKGYRAPEGMTRYLREDRIAQYGQRQKGFRDVLGQRGRIAQQRLISRPLRNATRPARQLASRVGGRVGGIAGKVPIVGPLIDFGIRTLILKENPGRAAAGAVGLGVGQALGSWIGGAIGGVAGSVVPIIGNALAGAAGVTIGSILGGLLGDFIGTSLYDFIAGMSNKQKPKGQARGGTVSQNRRPRRTSTTQVPTRRKIRPQETKPGKDIGGRKKIEVFYGTDKPSGSIQTRGETIVKSLEKTSRDVKKLPLDWIASIGGAYIDMTMGQKPDKKLAADVGKSFGMFVETAINNEVAATTGQITKALVGMANGGSVPANSLERGQIGKSVAKNIEERLQAIFDQSSTIALKNFKDQFSTLGGAAGFGVGPSEVPPGAGPSATSEEQREAFEKIRKIAEKLGSPNPEVTAAIAMWETGWLANPNSVYFASGKTNPFGQTGSGPKGSVTGKDGQQHAVYNNLEEGVKAHLDLWKSAYKGRTAAEIIESIRQGGGRGMYNTNPAWSTNILNTLQSATMPVSKVEALSTGFRTGLRTGPAGRIGAGTEYHIDGRFMYNVPLKDKIAMLDSMAAAHAQEGYVMEFSGAGVAGMRWNPGMPKREKEEFAKRILASHHANRHPWQAFDYFIIKRTAKDRFDKSAEGANVMAPLIRDGTYEYQEGGGGGRFLIIRDRNGNEVMRILHGDTGVPRPKELGKAFKMNELTEAQAQLSAQPGQPNLPGQTRQASITQALIGKGSIPFTYKGQQFLFKVNPDGSIRAFKSKNIFGYQEDVDIGGNKNKGLRDAINAKVQSMYGKPERPRQGGVDPGGNMQKGGILGPYSSLNSIKKDTSLSQEIVVMYQKEIVMVPSS